MKEDGEIKGLMGIILILESPQRQRFGDRIAGTTVMHKSLGSKIN